MIEHHHYWRPLHLCYYVVRCVCLDLSDRVNASRLPCAHVDNSQLQLIGLQSESIAPNYVFLMKEVSLRSFKSKGPGQSRLYSVLLVGSIYDLL